MLATTRVTRSKTASITRPLTSEASVKAESTRSITGSSKTKRTISTSSRVQKDTTTTTNTTTADKPTKKRASSTAVKKAARTTSSTETILLHSSTLPQYTPPAPLPASSLIALGTNHLLTHAPEFKSYLTNHPTVFSPLLKAHAPLPPHTSLAHHYFRSISHGIIAQQISGAAAASILAKFDALFPPSPTASGQSATGPTPEQVLSVPIETLRTAGLTARKAEYMHSLSTFFTTTYTTLQANSSTTTTPFTALPDETIIDLLTSVKGIGVWSAQMFLLFGMGRWDVFAPGDLGIQRGMAVWKDGKAGGERFKKSGKGKFRYFSEERMGQLAEPFRPYRSLLCLLLWKVSDTRVEVMGGEADEPGKKKRGGKKKKVEGREEQEEEQEEEEEEEEVINDPPKRGRRKKTVNVDADGDVPMTTNPPRGRTRNPKPEATPPEP